MTLPARRRPVRVIHHFHDLAGGADQHRVALHGVGVQIDLDVYFPRVAEHYYVGIATAGIPQDHKIVVEPDVNDEKVIVHADYILLRYHSYELFQADVR